MADYELRLQANGQLVKIATLKPIMVGQFPKEVLPRNLDIGGTFAKGIELDNVYQSSPIEFRVENAAEVRTSESTFPSDRLFLCLFFLS